MSKLIFDDNSFIEIRKSSEPDKVVIMISSRDGDNPRTKITNACEITMKEFKSLIGDVQ